MIHLVFWQLGGLHQYPKYRGYYLLKGSDDPIEICDVGDGGICVVNVPTDSDKTRGVAAPLGEPLVNASPNVQCEGRPSVFTLCSETWNSHFNPPRNRRFVRRRIGTGGLL